MFGSRGWGGGTLGFSSMLDWKGNSYGGRCWRSKEWTGEWKARVKGDIGGEGARGDGGDGEFEIGRK